MKITLHPQVEGAEPGDTITVDKDRGQWLIDNGYASADTSTTTTSSRRRKTQDEPDQAGEADAES